MSEFNKTYKRITFLDGTEKIVSSNVYDSAVKVVELEKQLIDLQFQIDSICRDYTGENLYGLIKQMKLSSIGVVSDV